LQERSGQVRIAGLQPRVETMISMTGVHKIVDIHRDVADAVEAFATKKGRSKGDA
jgi:anti-anti-sigma regulatory factor